MRSELRCPDHPLQTWRGIFGDYYCVEAGCDWWDIALEDKDAQ